MKKMKFFSPGGDNPIYVPGLLGSLVGSTAGYLVFLCLFVGIVRWTAPAWVGLTFLFIYLGGMCGLRLTMRFSRKYQFQYPKAWLLRSIVAGVLLFFVAILGQWLFSLNLEQVQEGGDGTVDIALLLDTSSSMHSYGYEEPRDSASIQFVESLDETSMVQVIAFGSKVVGQSELLTMDNDGQAALIEFIESIDSVGTTDFNAPMEAALETLDGEGRSGSSKAVILVTDGDVTSDADGISDSVLSSYTEKGIYLFTVRIADSKSAAAGSDLAAAAEETGGTDMVLVPENGSVDASALLEALQAAFDDVSVRQRVTHSNDQLISFGEISLYQFVVRTVALLLCMLLFSTGYFGRVRTSGLSASLFSALLVSLAITVLDLPLGMGSMLIALVFGTAVIRLNTEDSPPPLEEEGGVIHV